MESDLPGFSYSEVKGKQHTLCALVSFLMAVTKFLEEAYRSRVYVGSHSRGMPSMGWGSMAGSSLGPAPDWGSEEEECQCQAGFFLAPFIPTTG